MAGLPRLEAKRRRSAGTCKNGEMGYGGNDPSNWDGGIEGIGGGWWRAGCRRPAAAGGCLSVGEKSVRFLASDTLLRTRYNSLTTKHERKARV